MAVEHAQKFSSTLQLLCTTHTVIEFGLEIITSLAPRTSPYLDGSLDAPVFGSDPFADGGEEEDEKLALGGVVDDHCSVRHVQNHKPQQSHNHKHPSLYQVGAGGENNTYFTYWNIQYHALGPLHPQYPMHYASILAYAHVLNVSSL